MEHFGLLSILPPLLTIALAIITKDVIISLVIGILSGLMVVAGGNPFMALTALSDLVAGTLADDWNIRIMLFTILLGLIVGMLAKTGAAYALGDWAGKKIKTKTGALLFTWFFGLLIFFDDYFNSLTIGTCMRPLCDAKKISRAKLAYILDSTAAPVAILAPVSTWVVVVMGYYKNIPEFKQLGLSELGFFVRTIPFNLYAIFAILMVIFIAITHKDFGPMARSEARAEKGHGLYDEARYGAVSSQVESKAATSGAKVFDFLIPIAVLVFGALFFFPMTSWMIAAPDFGGIGAAMKAVPFAQAFNDTDSSMALMYASLFAVVFTYLYYLIRRLFTVREGSEALMEGFRAMVPAVMILTLAWSLGAVIQSSPADGGVGLNTFISDIVVKNAFPISLIPIIFYLFSCVIAFSSGTSWGTMAIMIPLGLPVIVKLGMATGLNPAQIINAAALTCGAVMGGAVFGDHCSPISDTTVLSSTGAAVPHLEHVATQMPYAVFVAVCVMAGTIVGGLTWNPIWALLTTAVLFVIGIYLISAKFGVKHYENA